MTQCTEAPTVPQCLRAWAEAQARELMDTADYFRSVGNPDAAELYERKAELLQVNQ